MNWNQLYYFCEIAREGSLKAAAQKLKVTSPTLSEHLAQLEKDLKTPLFIRQPRKLVLTGSGKQLYKKMNRLFDSALRSMDFVSPDIVWDYPVNIGFVPGSSRVVGSSFLKEYVSTYGKTDINFTNATQDYLEKKLAESKIDFGFSNVYPKKGGLLSRVISASPVKLYVSEKWAGQSLSQILPELPVLTWKFASGLDDMLFKFLQRKDLSIHSRITGEDLYTLYQFCESGMGIGVFSEDFVKNMGDKLISVKGCSREMIRMEKVLVIWLQDAKNTKAIQHLLSLVSGFSTYK